MDKQTIGILGGLGVIFSFLGSLFTIAGIVMLFIAYYNLGKNYSKDIFKNFLMSFIIGFASGIIVLVLFFAFASLEYFNSAIFVILLVLFYVSLIISAKFNYNANKITGKKLKIDSFRLGGKLNFIGAITSIVLVGFIISFIGQIFICIAFFKMTSK